MTERTYAEIFPPGEFIKEELEARGWSQVELAEILGKTPALVNELVMARRAVTPETAKALAHAFDTSAQYWMNLESAYQLWKTKSDDAAISRRAKLYSIAPIKEMVKRHWIEPSQNVDVLEQQVLKFFESKSIEDVEQFSLAHAARKSSSYAGDTPSLRAWLCRAKKLGKSLIAKAMSKQSLDEGFGRLRRLLVSVHEIRHVPHVLAEMGIRFLVLEALPHTRIDGACFWLDERSPVIALSLRFDRVDAFWFTLAHELGHVRSGDGLHRTFLDTDLIGEHSEDWYSSNPAEAKANAFAMEFLVPRQEMEDFIARTQPLFYGPKIQRFAMRIGVHPGVVVGQLHFRGKLSYAQQRKTLEKVRHVITQSALTDGWGLTPPSNL